MRSLAVIPARGGSKGVKRKNLHLLGGHPLIVWTIKAALASTQLDRVIVSTEDEEIASISRDHGADVPFLRPPGLAADDTPTLKVLQNVVDRLQSDESYEPDVVVTLQPTSPFRTTHHIDEALSLFKSDPKADSLVSCIPVPHIFNPYSIMRQDSSGYLEPLLDRESPMRRQDKTPVFARNGAAIYITRTNNLSRYIFGGRLMPYFMDEISSLDIDDESDFRSAEQVLQQPSNAIA